MASAADRIPVDHHDWHSPDYVEEWIARDVTRDAERRLRLREMLAAAPAAKNDPLAVLDVGGGYGVVTEEVLDMFPRAVVTLQDYSQPMLDRARARLAGAAGRVRYVLGDLRDPAWVAAVGGPFDLAVSAIAIHNLRDSDQIAACYRGIASVLKPGGAFLDYDLFELIGGLAIQMRVIERAGFTDVACMWRQERVAIIRALRPAGAG